MVICRGCKLDSSATTEWVLFDENIMVYFNLLTNLNVCIDDGLPQHLCESCNSIIHHFIKFRDKCISVDFDLRNNILNEVKIELDITNKVKQENSDSDEDNGYYGGKQEYDEIEIYKQEIGDDQNCQVGKPTRIKSTKEQPEIKVSVTKIKPKVKSKTKEFSCGLCFDNFEDDVLFKTHLDEHKRNNNCSICNKKFSNQYQTLAHRIKHLPSTQRNCYICRKKFHKEHYLEYHYKKQHFNETNTDIECQYCKREFRNPKCLSRHLLSAHNDTKQIVICDYCKKIYDTKYKLILHIGMHLNRRQLKCNKCDFSANFRSSLRMHIINKHTLGKVICKICSAAFPNQEYFERHKCKPRDGNEICPICGKTGIKRLGRHMRCHTSERKFKCDRCPATYKYSTAFRVHVDSHDGLRRHKCEYCPMTFGSGSVLIKHRRTHTGEKPFVCKICQKGFTGNHNLKVHMRVHGITNLIVKKNQDGENESNAFPFT